MTEEVEENAFMYSNIYPIAFLRSKLGIKSEDRYMVDMALAFKNFGHRVSFLTSSFDQLDCFEELEPLRGCFPVLQSGWWIPDNIFGLFRKTMDIIKSFWLTLRIILLPPTPKPEIIILDLPPFTLTVLKSFSNYKTFYVHHFSTLQVDTTTLNLNNFTPHYKTARILESATEVIVQTSCFSEIFRHIYPNFRKPVRILCPCVDVGLWKESPINMRRIVPDLPKNAITFVVFGDYRKRSNFKLALDSLEYLLTLVEGPIKEAIHMIIAGHCSEKSEEQVSYYEELVNVTSEKSYASQVTFLRQLPTVYKKVLIENCVGVVHPVKNELFSGPVLAAMSLGKPVIAVNNGFPAEVLVHRLSGILLEPLPEKFAAAMLKLATKPTVQHFIGEMARDTFRSHFTFQNFSKKLQYLLMDCESRMNITN